MTIIETVTRISEEKSAQAGKDYAWASAWASARDCRLAGIPKADLLRAVTSGEIVAEPGDGTITWATKYRAA